jgi:hypothetical protein
MGMYGLESARAKIDRANYHLSRLRDAIESDRKAKKYGIVIEHELQADEIIVKVVMPPDVFVHYSIIAGEIIGHARSALEHAVWEMVPAPIVGRTGFPVFTIETKADKLKPNDGYYDHHGIGKIEGINASAAAIIKAAQPFGPDYETNLLYILNKLWNRDKHQLLNFCAAYPVAIMMYNVRPLNTKLLEQIRIAIPPKVKDGTELFRERHPGSDVQVHAEIASRGVIFDGGIVDTKPVLQLLLKLIQDSDRIIDSLAKTI